MSLTSVMRKVRSRSPNTGAKPRYCVSYAWGDDTNDEGRARDEAVDRLCDEGEMRSKFILRDKAAMKSGDRISRFMKNLGNGDRVFIILSDKYLRSTYCMTELFEVFTNCREDGDEFIARTRVFVLPCADISTPLSRAQYAIYWQQRHEELNAVVKEYGQIMLSDDDNADFRRMSRFVTDTANILKLVQDTLRPREFKAFLDYGFDEPPGVI